MKHIQKDADTSLVEILMRSCGLSKHEGKVYIAVLCHEKAAIRDIARHTGINRTSLYEIVKRLEAQGILGTVRRGGTTCLVATNPERLLEDRRKNIVALEQA